MTGRPGPLRTFVALGDSQTEGVGDPVRPGVLRGWARRLADSLTLEHRGLILHNLARTGATTVDVRHDQLPHLHELQPDLTSLLIGVNDALRGDDGADELDHLVSTAAAHSDILLVMRLHDPAALLPLPAAARRRLRRRVDRLNDALDAAVARARSRTGRLPVVLDLAAEPASRRRDLFTVDRLHLNPRGHHALAVGAAAALGRAGYAVADVAEHDLVNKPVLHARWLAGTVMAPLLRSSGGR